MEFKIREKKHYNLEKYPKEDFDVARLFVERLKKELGDFLKAMILFGSTTRHTQTHFESDIDILIVVNDLTIVATPEVVETYRIITERTAVRTSRRLHITTLKMTSFWDYVKSGDPIAINMLRDGVPLYDTGFFEPLQVLLHQGRIRPSEEAIWTYYARAPATLLNSKWHLLQASLDLYWAVIDSAHAALMQHGEIPPTPAHVADLMDKALVKKRLLSSKYVDTMKFFYELSRKITHRQLQEISGKEYEDYYKRARDFVEMMNGLIRKR
jgi:predicted nucleotidyltransferase